MTKKRQFEKEESMNKIMNYLKKGDKSTTSIANQFSRNFYDAMRFLEELERDGKVERITMGRFIYWRLKR